jgi:hypothetical protein
MLRTLSMAVPTTSHLAGTTVLRESQDTDDPLPPDAFSISNQELDDASIHHSPTFSSFGESDRTATLPSQPDNANSWFFNNGRLGILPSSLLHLCIMALISLWILLAVFSSSIFLVTVHIIRSSYLVFYSATMWAIVERILVGMTGVAVWLPIAILWCGSLTKGWKIVTWRSVLCFATSATLAVGYCLLVAYTDGNYTASTHSDNRSFGAMVQTWSTGLMPNLPQNCTTRVALQQAPLFTRRMYSLQFARVHQIKTNTSYASGGEPYYLEREIAAFNWELFRGIQNNQALCGQGFLGNNDLYGLGIRCGVYIQWLSSILANNFLSTRRQEIQRIYLVFSLAICLATTITSFSKSCTFSVEIIILYWMFWGGHICVFGSAPCPIRLSSVSAWLRLDWMTAIVFLTLWSMTYHGIWFIWQGYDQVFARMPCGTWYSLLVPVLDPSERFWTLKDLLGALGLPVFFLVLVTFPWFTLLIVPEIKHAVQMSTMYQAFIRKCRTAQNEHGEQSTAGGKIAISQRVYRKIKRLHSKLRLACSLPKRRRGGIYLVTPVEVHERRQVANCVVWHQTDHYRLLRIRWAITGLLAFFTSIFAIECVLSWNKVQGVYSLSSTGQYIPLIISVASLVSVIWNVAQQEIVSHHYHLLSSC